MKVLKTKKEALLMILLLIFTSCKVYKLDHSDYDWQPYKKGDILIFENSNGKIDTINVRESNTRNAKEITPYKFFSEKHQINSSRGELNNDAPTIVQSKPILFKRNISLVYIGRENDSAYIGFSEYKPPANYNIFVPIKKMEDFIYEDNLLGKCYKVNNIDNYYNGFNNPLNSLFFSKKYGYLRFNFKDGNFVQLRKFIRNGVNILPNNGNGVN
ncbi:hypothetical protein [Kordia sp.]|uniref:hypothetical protein n=1 Tax=Kordia sp. TaxID=1965332 RepID=UPI003D2C9B4D